MLTKSSILVGGQAVIEGVMMRVPGFYATAVRLQDGTIKVKRYQFQSIIEKYKINNLYIIRGMFHLYESMKIGYQTLDWSAQMNEGKDLAKEKSFVDALMNFISILFAISLFIVLPLFFTFYFKDVINKPLLFNLISGVIRISIFLLYLILIIRLG